MSNDHERTRRIARSAALRDGYADGWADGTDDADWLDVRLEDREFRGHYIEALQLRIAELEQTLRVERIALARKRASDGE